VTLIGVVVRAAAVATMSATLLLPIADHHAVSRLPEVALQLGHPGADLHSLFVHHHPRGHRDVAAPTLAPDGMRVPVFAPAVPLPPGESGLAPEAAPAPRLFMPPRPSVPAARASEPIPISLLEPPPRRPPNRTA
jgi:hypothetical protein